MVLTYEHFYFIIRMSIKLVGFLFMYFLMTLLSNHFSRFFFWRKLLSNCYYKFQSGHSDLCIANIIIIIIITNNNDLEVAHAHSGSSYT